MHIANFVEPKHWGGSFPFDFNSYMDAVLESELDQGALGVYFGFFCIEEIGAF